MTIQPLTNNPNTSDLSDHRGDAPISEALIAQLAAEFFSAVPQQSPHGFNFEVPNREVQSPITHPPQPKDPFLALAGRVPSVAQQLKNNPNTAQHYVEPTADHPERRILASAPVIGGAHTPEPL